MKGRKPLPTAVKRLRGTVRRYRTNPDEPVIGDGKPSCPAWLNATARSAWRELEPLLSEARVLTLADRQALALCCDAIAEYRAARAVVESYGSTFEINTDSGSVVRPRPEVAIAQNAWARAMRGLAEFGLTPSSRSRVTAAPQDKQHPDADFLFGLAR